MFLVNQILFIFGLFFIALAQAETCNPQPSGRAVLEEMSGVYWIKGVLADFDPCHRSVDLKLPFGATKPPLMIISHGGGGLGPAEKDMAYAFRGLGFATLIYDAYQMNELYRDWKFWSHTVTNNAKQRMNFKVTLGAYNWAIKNDKVDTNRIYFHGLSNGATTVVNVAGVVDPNHVKGVFAEGTLVDGIGLPDDLKVPVRLIYGRLDNYGGRAQDEWRWKIQELCLRNGDPKDNIQPKGNSENCNMLTNPSNLTVAPIDWYEEQKKKKANIDIWWYDNAAHGMFIGSISKSMLGSSKRYGWTGADSTAREKFLADLKKYLDSQ